MKLSLVFMYIWGFDAAVAGVGIAVMKKVNIIKNEKINQIFLRISITECFI
jgi:hypothetical protein